MLVRADVLVAGMADQERTRLQLERPAAGAATKAPLPHIGEREVAVKLSKRRVFRPGCTPVIDHRDRLAAKNAGGDHVSTSAICSHRIASLSATPTKDGAYSSRSLPV